ncbi:MULTISPECIES: hypothetical protein [unclassified Caballeronia]|uniref:hypothetical protein n=1 Tax=unclassified Caballeronia TaxID=2646786 RepID=UPI001FD3EDEB|nr:MULTISPECIES: hypothetical protein [unclassified Caballeronia]
MNKQMDECGGAGDELGKRGQVEAEFQEFVQDVAAQRFFLSNPERRAARAMLAEGFCSVEVAAFLQASPWATYYRNVVREHHLPESAATRDALRKSFELGESGRVAAQRAIGATRKNGHEMFGPVTAPRYLD